MKKAYNIISAILILGLCVAQAYSFKKINKQRKFIDEELNSQAYISKEMDKLLHEKISNLNMRFAFLEMQSDLSNTANNKSIDNDLFTLRQRISRLEDAVGSKYQKHLVVTSDSLDSRVTNLEKTLTKSWLP